VESTEWIIEVNLVQECTNIEGVSMRVQKNRMLEECLAATVGAEVFIGFDPITPVTPVQEK
jgi:hypothetical protein